MYKVLKVVDGDTIEIKYDGKVEKVRLIGVNTPETKHPTKGQELYGPEAYSFTKSYLQDQLVEIEFDVSPRDMYGRLLAYVYVGGEMVNELLIANGFARISKWPPNTKHADHFKKLQDEAKKNLTGLWSFKAYNPSLEEYDMFVGHKKSKVYHTSISACTKRISSTNKVDISKDDKDILAKYSPCKTCLKGSH